MENKNIIGLRLHFCKLKYDNSFYTNQCQNLGEYTIIDCTSRCKEFASDCEITNDSSIKLHQSLGFDEASRLVHFVKKL